MPVLVDTSVWIDHFRGGDVGRHLVALLEDDLVLCHPAVVGELAMGNLPGPRAKALRGLDRLPRVEVASDLLVRQLIEKRHLWGRGIGWTDAHLLASVDLSADHLWTLDGRLRGVAVELGLAWRSSAS